MTYNFKRYTKSMIYIEIFFIILIAFTINAIIQSILDEIIVEYRLLLIVPIIFVAARIFIDILSKTPYISLETSRQEFVLQNKTVHYKEVLFYKQLGHSFVFFTSERSFTCSVYDPEAITYIKETFNLNDHKIDFKNQYMIAVFMGTLIILNLIFNSVTLDTQLTNIVVALIIIIVLVIEIIFIKQFQTKRYIEVISKYKNKTST